MQIVVTGANGQLGSELCRQLPSRALPLGIDALDITDRTAVWKTLGKLHPEALVNCAAYNLVDRAESEPRKCRAVNATAVEYLVEACQELDCPLVQLSTNYVFGGGPATDRPLREDDPPAPQGIYAQSKLDSERMVARHAKHLIVRTCGLYARPQDRRAKNFVSTMLCLGRNGGEVRVVDDLWCAPSYAPHAARAILFLLEAAAAGRAPWGTYHVTNTGATTWYRFAEEIFRLAGMAVSLRRITAAEYGAPAPRPAYAVLDTAAYHRLGGPAMPEWKTALAEYFSEI